MNLPDEGFLKFFASWFWPERYMEAAESRGKAKAIEQIAEQARVEEAIRNGDILCPPNTPPEKVMNAIINDNLNRMVDAYSRRFDIASRAYAMLPQEILSQPLNLRRDLSSRTYRYCGDESEEEIKELWARLLAEEIQHTKSISLRTLSVLHTMTGEEARTLKKYSEVIILGLLVNEQLNTLSIPDELTRDFRMLHEAGLIDWMNYGEAINLAPNKILEYETFSGKYIIQNTSSKVTLSLFGIPLTQAGRELAGLDSLPPNKELIVDTLPDTSRAHLNIQFHEKS